MDDRNPNDPQAREREKERKREEKARKKERKEALERLAQREARRNARRAARDGDWWVGVSFFAAVVVILALAAWRFLGPGFGSENPADSLHACEVVRQVPCLEAGLVVVPDGRGDFTRVTIADWNDSYYDPSIPIP